MGRRDLRRVCIDRGGVVLLALLVLGAGLCVFDHDDGGSHDHGMSQDVCWLMLAVPAFIPMLAGLVPCEWVASAAGVEPIVVPLSILDPPPRPLLA